MFPGKEKEKKSQHVVLHFENHDSLQKRDVSPPARAISAEDSASLAHLDTAPMVEMKAIGGLAKVHSLIVVRFDRKKIRQC